MIAMITVPASGTPADNPAALRMSLAAEGETSARFGVRHANGHLLQVSPLVAAVVGLRGMCSARPRGHPPSGRHCGATPDEVEAHGIVVLHRVVCRYPDYERHARRQ
jgi:hypothetical protein